METYLARASIFLTDGSATNTAYPTLTRQLWARLFVFVSQPLKLGAWASEGIANIIVRVLIYSAVDILTSTFIDCGIRPATSAEAEWLQDYIRKSNNNAGQTSVNAARAQDQSESSSRGDDGSGDDEDEDSEGPSSNVPSKRNSLALSDVKGSADFHDLSDKTPTAATLLSQVQAAGRPAVNTFPAHAPIRRHTGPQQDGGLPVQSPSPQSANPAIPNYVASQQQISVRHLPQFPSIEEAVGNNSSSAQSQAAREVWGWFQDHLDALLESVRSFRFDQFEMHLRTFWSSLTGNHREVVHAPAIAGLMAKADAIVYDVSHPY